MSASRAEAVAPRLVLAALALASASGACADAPAGAPPDAVDPQHLAQLMDPATCAPCHAEHYREWSGSMHAYAADDPVFLAMNARGQRETGGALGDFCVSCHAPMAVRTGATTDGTNLDEVPQHLKGVTCYFCHSVEAVEGTHNNPLRLATDGVMRGGLREPVDSGFHASAYSPLHDRNRMESSDLCGSCHDIVAPPGAHIERTFHEWRGSVFGRAGSPSALTCGGCHMDGRDAAVAAGADMPIRRAHSHAMPGVDVALTEWPQRDEQRAAIQALLDTTVRAELCVWPHAGGADVQVLLENVAAGHSFPSGAAQDRRAWLELVAEADDAVLFETGRAAEGQPLASLDDPHLWVFGDKMRDAAGQPTHDFWEAASYESELLPAATALSPLDPAWIDTHVIRTFGVVGAPSRVEMRLKLRPIALDVIDDLIASGDLDPKHRDALPTFTLKATELVWTPDLDTPCVP